MSTYNRTRRRTATEDSLMRQSYYGTPGSNNNVTTIQVVAPCDMEEGYTFMAEVTTSVIWPGSIDNNEANVTSIQPVQVIVVSSFFVFFWYKHDESVCMFLLFLLDDFQQSLLNHHLFIYFQY